MAKKTSKKTEKSVAKTAIVAADEADDRSGYRNKVTLGDDIKVLKGLVTEFEQLVDTIGDKLTVSFDGKDIFNRGVALINKHIGKVQYKIRLAKSGKTES